MSNSPCTQAPLRSSSAPSRLVVHRAPVPASIVGGTAGGGIITAVAFAHGLTIDDLHLRLWQWLSGEGHMNPAVNRPGVPRLSAPSPPPRRARPTSSARSPAGVAAGRCCCGSCWGGVATGSRHAPKPRAWPRFSAAHRSRSRPANRLHGPRPGARPSSWSQVVLQHRGSAGRAPPHLAPASRSAWTLVFKHPHGRGRWTGAAFNPCAGGWGRWIVTGQSRRRPGYMVLAPIVGAIIAARRPHGAFLVLTHEPACGSGGTGRVSLGPSEALAE